MAKTTNHKIKSIRDLAAKLGVSHTALAKSWLPRWTFGKGPWNASDVPSMKRWGAENLNGDRSASPGISNLADESSRKIFERARAGREVIKYKSELGRVHDVDECQFEQQERNRAVVKALTAYFPNAITQAISSLEIRNQRAATKPEIEQIITECVHRALSAISGAEHQ